jgi:tubby and related proteins
MAGLLDLTTEISEPYMFLWSVVMAETGKFLLSAKRHRKTTCTEYTISMDADNISRSSRTYIGKVRYDR